MFTKKDNDFLNKLVTDYAISRDVNGIDSVIKDVISFINLNYCQNLSLKSLALKYCFCEVHLSRKFKKEVGFTITEYITFVRILKAKELLERQFNSITEVAGLCGFNDSNYFSCVFRKHTGITPSDYAKKYKNSKTG